VKVADRATMERYDQKGIAAMDILATIILTAIVTAFVVFAAVLAYADYATRVARRYRQEADARGNAETASVSHRKAA
jgi:hypothetical protein